jgi:NADH:ubiquinone oxidoreductase subunit
MTIATRIYTLLQGQLVGSDENGNRYYQSKKRYVQGRLKRWVLYKSGKEPTTVPPQWHGWLHYMTDTIPSKKHKWQKEAIPNQTGTENAYFPAGAKQRKEEATPATGSYEAWKP